MVVDPFINVSVREIALKLSFRYSWRHSSSGDIVDSLINVAVKEKQELKVVKSLPR